MNNLSTMKKLTGILILLIYFAANTTLAQVPEPAAPQTESILLVGGTAHIGNGEVIENSVISIVDGKIGICADATRVRLDMSQFDQKIDVSGKHIYPGLILPSTNLGLEEISAVRATRDYNEVGGLNPNVRSLIAYNTDSELIPTLRYNGILLAQTTPEGGLVSGTSSIMKLDGWNWEDAAYQMDDGVHINWPQKQLGPKWWLGESRGQENKKYGESVQQIKTLFEDARSYHAITGDKSKNLKLEALKGVLEGTKRLYIHTENRAEIIESVQWAKNVAGIDNVVIVGASEAYYAIDFLKEHNIPVILGNVHELPNRPEEAIDLPYRLPSILTKNGLVVALAYNGRLASSRNLPFYAGTAAAYGLSKEEALKLVTSNAAEILGISDRTGTLEPGKDANIVVSSGDMLDMRFSKVEIAFIEGKKLNLDGKQQLLHQRFKNKYEDN